MKPADLIFVKGTGFISEEIESITNSKYSHAAGIIKPNELIEAGPWHVRYQGLDYYSAYDVFTCDSLNDEQRQKIVQYAVNQLDKHYDYLMLIWEWVRLKLNIILPYVNTDSVICSELWSDAYRSVGVDLCPGIKYSSPNDLAESKLLRKVIT